jgi:hypothetical protein
LNSPRITRIRAREEKRRVKVGMKEKGKGGGGSRKSRNSDFYPEAKRREIGIDCSGGLLVPPKLGDGG